MLTFRRRLPGPAPAPAPEAGFPLLRVAPVADMLPTVRVAVRRWRTHVAAKLGQSHQTPRWDRLPTAL